MINDMYQRGERYASSDMHQVLKENATFISFPDACLMC